MAIPETKLINPDELLTLQEAAELSGLSAATLRRYANDGKLRAVKRGHDWFVTRTNLAFMLHWRDNRTNTVKPLPARRVQELLHEPRFGDPRTRPLVPEARRLLELLRAEGRARTGDRGEVPPGQLAWDEEKAHPLLDRAVYGDFGALVQLCTFAFLGGPEEYLPEDERPVVAATSPSGHLAAE